ncbi:class I SAM-dependent methyltransferase [Mycolicibacterium rufum]|uniref:Class I SAM-dependent methyltransferase n=1 Tax=Mycolicibacterium rufum TaxID=318424 RepID=A0A9X2YA15_9MYCO|nr:class I SAM-dependent methyltransferase [Mycolicibacterium rufum]KGI69077.1 SAM-dependent methyltransferase [Mycolicibacterium rufum]MCV7069555.1 class I SAM-dependent methyltransferase [Mycolicibacterium rufum]ULP35259.1 class I SAM-dependent methyltransferase [Mycolicibacterium rufum]
MDEYWNHNTAYHRWVVSLAAAHHGDVLDVGCGDGLLAQRLAPVSRSVVGLEPDSAAARRARTRLAGVPGVSVVESGFADYPSGPVDLIVFVASLHHLDLRSSLARARGLLRPGGELAVVGLSANTTVRDWLWSGMCLPAVLLGSRLHRERRDIGVVVAEPREGLDEIRRTAEDVLPGVWIRRALYYRYLMRWRKPEADRLVGGSN